MSTSTRPRARAQLEPADPGGASRAVLLLGIVLGTALVILAVWQGARPRLPGMPALLGLVVGVLLMWGIFMLLAAVTAQLVRLHHRDMRAFAGRHGRRAALASARGVGRRYRAAYGRLAGWAGPRWQGRGGDEAEDDDQAPPDSICGICKGRGCPACLGTGWRSHATDPAVNSAQQARDAAGKGNLCAACGHPGTEDDPLVIADGYRVHHSHTTDPADGFHDPAAIPAGAPVPATNGQDGEDPMSTDAVPVRNRLPDQVRANAPAGWRALAGDTADFEPDSDEELLGWMAGQVSGISTYGESLADLYETCVEGVRLDPVAMAALHDAADAAGDFATAMAYARQKFAAHYAEVREFVSDGGVLPKDGDFITGEGDD